VLDDLFGFAFLHALLTQIMTVQFSTINKASLDLFMKRGHVASFAEMQFVVFS